MSAAAPAPRYRRVALAACFGTFLEWYDFLTFATLASHLGLLFFPSTDPVAALLASLATFGIGMVVRPLGAAVFGSLGDRLGRRRIFMATIGLMGAATFAVGLLPTYAAWGLGASAALIALRVLQGLAMGGEIGGANVYLSEHADPAHRGAQTSVLQLMGGLGILASGSLVLGLQTWLTPEQFNQWGWRVPFWLSALLLLASIKARLALRESPAFQQVLASQAGVAKTPLRDCWRDAATRKHMLLLLCCVSAGGSVLFFSSQVYTGVFLKNVLHMNPVLAGRFTTLATLALVPLTLLAGTVSDRLGRRPVVLTGLWLGALGLLPVFAGLTAVGPNGNPLAIGLLLLVLVFALACVTGPQTALLAELFNARTRYSAVGLPHNLAAGWVGGLTPLAVTALAQHWGASLWGLAYPAGWLLLAAVVGTVWLPETRGRSLGA